MKIRKERDFISCFDTETGSYMRTGMIRDGRITQEDPFMSNFPELLDVGIMGHCKHGAAGLCLKAGVQCYQDGLHSNKPNMSLEDFEKIVMQCKGNTYQIALGGCGDPDQHEAFEEILKICRIAEIVPNFTTSGLGMTEKIAALCKKYCGAVAVSWYRSPYTLDAIRMLLDAGVRTNIHYVLSGNTMEEAMDRIVQDGFPRGINAVVFLLHKPIGLGSENLVIKKDDKRFQTFLQLIEDCQFPYKIGFDSCTVPALIGRANTNSQCLDTCEGARWSAYISADMQMMPCSFDNQSMRWAVDLRTHTIREAWNSDTFEAFRDRLRRACPDCFYRAECMGGCPICPEIVLCDRGIASWKGEVRNG